MSIFMLLAQPVFLLLILSFYRFKTNYVYSFFKGLLIYIPVYIIYIVVFKFINESYRPFFLFSYILFKNYFLYEILLLLSFIFIFRSILSTKNTDELIFTFFAFSAGFYFGTSCVDFIVDFNIHDYFILFLLPLYRISFTAVFSVIIVYILESYGLHRVFYIGFLFVVILLVALGDFFYRINYYNLMLIFGVSFFLAGVVLFVLLSRKILYTKA